MRGGPRRGQMGGPRAMAPGLAPGAAPSMANGSGGGFFGLGGPSGKALWGRAGKKVAALSQLGRSKRRGYSPEGLLQRPELPRDFLVRADEFFYFVETALLPGYSLKDFQEQRAGCTMQSMQREVPISARAGLTSAKLADQNRRQKPPGRFDADAANAEELLREIRSHDPRAYMHVPRAHCNLPIAVDAENRRVHVTLENMKEMALQAEFGLPDDDDSMRTVRKFVEGLWCETNRINAKECREILSDMFYLAASLGPSEVGQLCALWVRMVEESKRKGKMVFLETQRLTLLPFHQVFVQSEALRHVLCHYVRSPADEAPVDAAQAAAVEPGDGESRGGVSRGMLRELLAICLVADDQMRRKFVKQVDLMASLSQSQDGEVLRSQGLVVSSSHMDVHALAAIFSGFLNAWKGDKVWQDPQREGKGLRPGEKVWLAPRNEWQPLRFAEMPEAATSAEQAVERLEKMSVVRQTIVRQLQTLSALYADVGGREAVGRSDGTSSHLWAGTVLVSEEHEKLELFSVYMLQQALSCMPVRVEEGTPPTMFSVQETKHMLMMHGLVRCPTIEQLFYQLNGVKMRLLGPRCEFLAPPAGTLAAGSSGKSDSKFKYSASKRRQGSKDKDDDAPTEVTWQLSATVVSVKNLRPGSASVSVKLKCVGQRYSTPSTRRTVSGQQASAIFAEKEFLWNDVCQERDDSVLEVRCVEESSLGVGDTLIGKAEVGLDKFKGVKSKQAEWHELRKNGKVVADVCVELKVTQIVGGADGRRGKRSAGRSDNLRFATSASAVDSLLADEGNDELEFFTLSGGWQGYTWHAPLPGGGVAATMLATEMDLVFSAGGELPAPHLAISGTGSDHVGHWELQSGRSYTQSTRVEWVQTYNAPLKEAFKRYDDSGREANPEIFFEGTRDPDTNVISGEWHMAYTMRATLYRDREAVGKPYEAVSELRGGAALRSEDALPVDLQSSGVMMAVRHPDLWEQRHELAALVDSFKRGRLPQEALDEAETVREPPFRSPGLFPMRRADRLPFSRFARILPGRGALEASLSGRMARRLPRHRRARRRWRRRLLHLAADERLHPRGRRAVCLDRGRARQGVDGCGGRRRQGAAGPLGVCASKRRRPDCVGRRAHRRQGGSRGRLPLSQP